MANKPSQYIPLWDKLQKEKFATIRTAFPQRIKKAIIKRKHLAKHPGKLHFRHVRHVGSVENHEVVEIEITLSENTRQVRKKVNANI